MLKKTNVYYQVAKRESMHFKKKSLFNVNLISQDFFLYINDRRKEVGRKRKERCGFNGSILIDIKITKCMVGLTG